MKTSKTPIAKAKEGRYAIRKKAKRIEQSRDNLKAKNREKAVSIKKLKDRLTELESSRDHWRKQSTHAIKQCRTHEDNLKESARKIDALKTECDQLQQEIETYKKKKMNPLFC